jgi:hypothetical protein
MKRPPKNQPTTPSIEDEQIMIDIMFQIAKMKQNQMEFKKVICEFFDEMLSDDIEDETNY